VGEALREKGVVRRTGPDVRHPEAIPQDLHRAIESIY